MVKISKTSKLDGIKSWSLQALDTCPGSLNEDGTLVDACSGCYATTGNYRFSNVKAPRLHNREDWQRLDWVDDMVNALNDSRYFRWFDSGDMYALGLAEKIFEVMKRTPWVLHWLPTRMHKFPKYRRVLSAMKQLDNVSVRFSSDSVTGEFIPGTHGSVIIPSVDHVKPGLTLCEAYSHGGMCNGCRKCWDKSVDVIAYPAHGVKMAKVIKIKAI
jgi:hypothetical protein